ncbi:NEW3 domain-containing protein [Bacillus kwashiorkori]|uniref:COG1470 family protein n=1 Tax=Bacillus kwashiorkori TaxID=1522318 RepID=UPI0007804E29|nr:NEW3 domain-containing protein [Bacillus kwashiorkori]
MLKRKLFTIFVSTILLAAFVPVHYVYALEGITLFTPHTGVTASPGETIHYNVDIINEGSAIQSMSFMMEDLPKGWKYKITSDGSEIRQLSVKGNSEASISADITVPLDAKKGDYSFKMVAKGDGNSSSVTLSVSVTKQGSIETELTSNQTNLEGHADSTFTYTVSLNNKTTETQNYALSSKVEDGWSVRFLSEGNSVTSISLEPNTSKELTVEVKPPQNVKEGTYNIPITAATANSNSDLTLEAVVTGSFGIEIGTPSGVLSDEITAGKEKTIELEVKNTGTAPLKDITLSANTPSSWEVTFNSEEIAELAAGKTKKVKATITAPDEAITGDYVVTFKATTAEVSADATFRMSVETSTVWGLIAVFIIIAVVVGLYLITRKFGRR